MTEDRDFQHVLTFDHNNTCDCWGMDTSLPLDFPEDYSHQKYHGDYVKTKDYEALLEAYEQRGKEIDKLKEHLEEAGCVI